MDATRHHPLYEIRIRGPLGETLLAGFPGFDAMERDGETLLTGTLPDQAALFGVLAQVEALGLELLEVRSPKPQAAIPATDDSSAASARDLARDTHEGGTTHG
jgi:hypothetical protein